MEIVRRSESWAREFARLDQIDRGVLHHLLQQGLLGPVSYPTAVPGRSYLGDASAYFTPNTASIAFITISSWWPPQ